MEKWKLLITRETVLLERYLRVAGYQDMLGDFSQVKVKNLLVVNNDGLTAQYIYLPEEKKRYNLIWTEYRRGYLKKLVPFWKEIINKLKISTKSVFSKGDAEAFKNFIKHYKLTRAIVFYTNDLLKILEFKKFSKNIKNIKEVGYWHENAEVESCRAWDMLLPFFKKVCHKNGLILEDLMYYLPSEFLKLLKGKKQIFKSVLKSRKKHYVLCLQNGKIKFYTGKRAYNIEKKELLQKEEFFKIREIKGVVASGGYAKGRVRIVNTKSQMLRMEKGEILVSIMTTPRLLPAVKKAAAIITDEGGITCHAAIVSRELKISCIIGTKIATKVLKDGQLVEVDANKGMVKILRK